MEKKVSGQKLICTIRNNQKREKNLCHILDAHKDFMYRYLLDTNKIFSRKRLILHSMLDGLMSDKTHTFVDNCIELPKITKKQR